MLTQTGVSSLRFLFAIMHRVAPRGKLDFGKALSGAMDVWFRPKGFESERLYERLGALLLKRYVPSGGDLIMHRLRRNHPNWRLVTPGWESLRRYERRTRLNESIHLIAFFGLTVLAAARFASGSLNPFGLSVAMTVNLIFGFWPVVLQRYNRLRLYRALELSSYLQRRRSESPQQGNQNQFAD